MMSTPQMPLDPDLIKNVKDLLAKKVEGYAIAEIGKEYFGVYRLYVYPEKYGLKTWGDILVHPQIKNSVEIYNSGLCARIRATPLPSTPSSTNNFSSNESSASSSTSHNRSVTAVSSAGTLNSNRASGIIMPDLKRSSTPQDEGPDMKRGNFESSSDYESTQGTEVTDVTHVSITPHNEQKLAIDRRSINWIPREPQQVVLTFSTLILERTVGPEQQELYIDCTYCSRPVLEKLMDVKANIKRINAEKFAKIRNKYNQFEFDKGGIFTNGAAIKLANIDALMGYGLTNPKFANGNSMLGPNELLYFVDVYGSPGGYAEYFLWKKKWQCKGFGIAPRGKFDKSSDIDYNLVQAEHYPRESFEPFYGENGLEGTGEINKPYNTARFIQFVRESTDEQFAHVMIASGGDRNEYVDEDQKEIRCKYLFMNQLLIALQVVRVGGHYVSRIYDMYTPFTVGLIYLMYRCFDQVAVFKPESSLPASAERYIICKWRKPDSHCREIINYLGECQKLDWLAKRVKRGNEEPADIMHLVSRERIRSSWKFCEYINHVNAELGTRQYNETYSLTNAIQRNSAEHYIAQRLRQIQEKCLEMWGVPSKTRQRPKYSKASTPEIRAKKLITPWSIDFFTNSDRNGEVNISLRNLKTDMPRPKEWKFMPISATRGFFLCLGGKSVFKYGNGRWTEVNEGIELMNNTLIYADIVDEVQINGTKQSITTALHIIDAILLGGRDIRELPFNERYDLVCKFAKSMDKRSREDLATIRAKRIYDLCSFKTVLQQVTEGDKMRIRDGGENKYKFLIPVQKHKAEELRFVPSGFLFIKTERENMMPADARFSFSNRLFWRWTEDLDIKIPAEFSAAAGETNNGREEEMEEEEENDIVDENEEEVERKPISAIEIFKYLIKCTTDME